MDTPLAFGFRDALDTMHARFKFQPGIRAVAADLEHDFLAAAQLGHILAEDLGGPAALFGVHCIHAPKRVRKQCAFLASRAATDFHNHVFIVVRVARDEQRFQLCRQALGFGSGSGKFLLRQLAQIRVGKHFLRLLLRSLRRLKRTVSGYNRLQAVALTQQPRRLFGVVIQVGRGKTRFQLIESGCKGLQLVKHDGPPF